LLDGRPRAFVADVLDSWPASLLLACVLTITFAGKRPSQLFHAQLFAEDGSVFIADALTRGWSDLLSPRVGYLELFPRLASHLVVSFDMMYWPLVANLSALAATFGLYLYAMRLSLPLSERLGQGALICLVPYGAAIYANMTYFVVVPLLFYPLVIREVERTRRVAPRHYVFLLVVAATGPWALFLFPVAIGLWLGRGLVRGATAFAAAHALALVVAAIALFASSAAGAPIHVMPSAREAAALVYEAMYGLFAVNLEPTRLAGLAPTVFGSACVAVCVAQAATRRPPLLLASLVAGLVILAGGLWRTASLYATSEAIQPWGGGERYFVLLLSTISMLALATLSDARAGRAVPRIAAVAAALALALMGANGLADYSRPALPDFDWAAEVARSRSHGVKEVRIPPGGVWTIKLP